MGALHKVVVCTDIAAGSDALVAPGLKRAQARGAVLDLFDKALRHPQASAGQLSRAERCLGSTTLGRTHHGGRDALGVS